MARLRTVAVLVLVVALMYSVVTEVWRAVSFDSEFTGLVQRVAAADPSLQDAITQLAEDHGIRLSREPMDVSVVGTRYEVTVRYTVLLGLGGIGVPWTRAVSAFTEGGRPYGAPGAEEQSPRSAINQRGFLAEPGRIRKSLQGAGSGG